MIVKADKEELIRNPQPKQKMKCPCHFKTPVELIVILDSKKEPESGISSVLQQFIAV